MNNNLKAGLKLLGLSIVFRVLIFWFLGISWSWSLMPVRVFEVVLGMIFIFIWFGYGYIGELNSNQEFLYGKRKRMINDLFAYEELSNLTPEETLNFINKYSEVVSIEVK